MRCSLHTLGKRVISSLLILVGLCVLLLVNSKHNHITEPSPSPLPTQTLNKDDVNCGAIYDMDPVEIGKSLIIRKTHLVEDTDESLSAATSNCPMFLKTRGYDDVWESEEEMDFPIAYSLVVHKNAWMVERLIRTVYSPTNIYCIHYDGKSPPEFISALKSLAQCLPNVFLSTKTEVVFYGDITRLKADLNCLSDLLKSEVQWRYVINLCGQDLPLRTNIELVSELKKLNGANMLETSRPTDFKRSRFTFHHELRNNTEFGKFHEATKQEKVAPPHGIEMFTGSAYFVLSRDFVDFVSSSAMVRDFLSWSEDTYSPDEHFWATLVRMPGVPGEVPRSHPDISDLMSKTRLVKWEYLEAHVYPPCTGAHVRSVCIFGAAELHWLLNYGHWFANKFDPKVDRVAVQCLEEKLEERRKLFHSKSLTWI